MDRVEWGGDMYVDWVGTSVVWCGDEWSAVCVVSCRISVVGCTIIPLCDWVSVGLVLSGDECAGGVAFRDEGEWPGCVA